MEVSRPVGKNAAEDVPASATWTQSRLSEYSSGKFSLSLEASQAQRMSETGGRVSSTYGQRQTEMRLKAADFDDLPPERTKDYKGRIRTWPGLLLLLLLLGGAAIIIVKQAMETSEFMKADHEAFEREQTKRRKIKDGMDDDKVLMSDDGQVGNPKKYPDMGCELPDYQSKKGKIIAVSKNGTEVPVGIKGVNWFGMETGLALPFGLWENMDNGTSVYEVAAFLSRNNFNSVRLPVCIKNILNDVAPEKSLINLNTNRAVNITSYITTVQSIVEALGYRQVSVLISLHTLDQKKSGGAWFSEELEVTEDQFLKAVDILTKNLCSSKYWNIVGLDLKNEPHECSWGGAEPDWQKGATLIGNRMLEGCPNWLAFVEGIASKGTITLNGKEDTFFDWWGGGLSDASGNPPTFDIENKLVWSPHYYNTGVSPAWYLYDGGTQTAEGGREGYVELDDETLRNNVEKTMEKMFGYLLEEDTNSAMVMGEFAGLYSKDAHPMLTTKRTTDYTIEVMLKHNYAGAYMWSLNPESAYQFNPAETFGHFTEGLLEDDWLTPNKVFVKGMAALDEMKNLQPFPCFPEEVEEVEETTSSLEKE
uniref:Glycoside hydrolase family 5 domain-containing protein n=1 Tax=Hyaloperonospora arabidopsidis (strain Emoy2) TaxID=559515 RepID=M4B799_HYAAE